MTLLKQPLALVLAISLSLASAPVGFADQTDESAAVPMQDAPLTPGQLQQLVAPIALYPDELVAQVLAASSYPTQVVEADRWLQEHPDLKEQQLGDEVDKQQWDASVKALTQFPSVLANMDKNLSWTSSLGDAYVNQQQDVMSAVQIMRERARQAGNLNTTQQQVVTTQGKTIVIEPAVTNTVYVPTYDPWLVYGSPVVGWPGWYPYPGLFWSGPGIAFGVGFGIGFFGGFGWGWHHWGCDWHHHALVFNHRTYISHSQTFINRNHLVHNRAGSSHGGFEGHAGPRAPSHGFAATHNHSGGRTFGGHAPAFSGFHHGGVTRMNSFRGRSSFGGGFHGGGFHGGGRR